MKLAILATVILGWNAGMATANEFCNQLDQMVSSGVPPSLQQSNLKSCGPTKEVDAGVSYFCYWQFEFRSEQAKQHYLELSNMIGECAKKLTIHNSTQVNHPDSYDQLLYENKQNDFSLSLKDKGGLDKTLVFLRASKK